MLTMENVDTYYGERHVLYKVSLRIAKGAVVAMLGRNGMGKTTIIRTIMGLTPPKAGEIRLNNEPINHLPPHEIARRGIAFVPQGRGIFPSLSVQENVTIGLRKVKKADGWTVEKIHKLFPILKWRSKLSGHLLSGGEQQMLAIARALMTNPDMILMDEPSEGLAPMMVQEVSGIINQLKGSHSVLLAEQNINMALAVADYIYVISKGEVVFESVPEELKNNDDIKTKYLGV